MSVSPSFPHGAPTLAEVLITRTFAKPTNPFVDGDFLDALEHADDGKPKAVPDAVKPAAAGGGAAPQDQHGAARPPVAAAPASGGRVDVRV